MKLTSLALAAAAITVITTASSCKKEDEKPKSKTELLTAGSWKVTAYMLVSGATTYDFWKEAEPCLKDNITTFVADGTLIGDEGATKCNAGDDQTYTSTWKFAENETKIEFDEELYTIESLTSTQLKVSVTTTSQGTTVVQNITFSH
ncbi:MAG TPA: hypothetical protein PLQ65_07505 [Flavihumibacter sp.]|nr:hypothetical protein [Bacteroidota bacterium]HQD09493.1 hypothetical protein [Flavihumibacter sp.]